MGVEGSWGGVSGDEGDLRKLRVLMKGQVANVGRRDLEGLCYRIQSLG